MTNESLLEVLLEIRESLNKAIDVLQSENNQVVTEAKPTDTEPGETEEYEPTEEEIQAEMTKYIPNINRDVAIGNLKMRNKEEEA